MSARGAWYKSWYDADEIKPQRSKPVLGLFPDGSSLVVCWDDDWLLDTGEFLDWDLAPTHWTEIDPPKPRFSPTPDKDTPMLKKNFPPVIISGFPGVGKTYLCQHRKDLKISDSDSSSFSWDESSGKKVRHPDWPDNYVKHVKSLVDAKDHDLILVSSHQEVREALSEADLKFVLVYPSMAIKEEYIQRYIDRGNNESFVGLLEKNYDDWIDALCQSTTAKVELGPGQYLADVVDRIIAVLMEFGEPEPNPELVDFFVADRIANRLNDILSTEPELINKLVLPREARESPPTVIGLLNTMFDSKVRIVYEYEDGDNDDTVTRIYAVRHYPPAQKHIS